MSKTAILLIAHGSRRVESGEAFAELAARVAARARGTAVAHAFMSMAQPDIQAAAAELVAGGAAAVGLLPYFLHRGVHLSEDLPQALAALRTAHPGVAFELLPPLENDPLLEDLLVDRVAEATADPAKLPTTGGGIEALSHEIIDTRLAREALAPGAHAVARRIIHATADFGFAQSLRLHPEAVDAGVAALRGGKPVICDSTILQAGITRTAAEALCAIRDEDVRARAQAEKITRAAAAMDKLAPRMDGAIVAVGNAPTALWRIMELAEEGRIAPALVVGLPVGFVGARESKCALLETALVYITNTSPRGGSPAAAAAANALALLAEAEA